MNYSVENRKEKKKIKTILILVIILLLIIGISYALLRKKVYGEKGKIIYHTRELDVVLEEDSATSIGLANALPISDEEGKNSEQVYRFSVVNNSDTDLAYKIYLDNDSKAKEKCGNTCEEMSGDMVKYELRKEEESSINSLSSRLLKIDNIKANSKNTYELRLWLGTNADDTVSEKYFFGQIKVEAIQWLKGIAVETLLAEFTNDEAIQDYNVDYKKEDISAKENKMYVFNHKDNKGTQQSDWSEEELKDYRYIGKDPNNYVTFNNETAGWRIIGIETVDDGSGKREKRIKLIRKNPLPVGTDNIMSWDNKPTETGSSNSLYGSNDWYDSRLMYLLNPNHEEEQTGVSGSIYWNRQGGNCPKGQINQTIDCNFTSTGLESEAQQMIGNAKWYLGGNNTADGELTESCYEFERSETVYKSRKISWTGKVGLMYPSDYGYATSGGNSANRTTCLAKDLYRWSDRANGILDCKDNDWLFDSSTRQCTITPYSSSPSITFFMDSTGRIEGGSTYFSCGVHPVVYLVSNIKLIKGTGTESNPFEFS